MSDIVIFESGDHQVQVRLEGDSVWLSLGQLAELFERDKSVISRHLKNIFETKELDRRSVVAKNATTAADGKTYQVEYFSLDAIISVGYRVNSRRATQFRIWATNTLKQHLVDGYTINQQRLRERGVAFEQAMDLLSRTLANRQLVTAEGEAVLQVIAEYSRSWSLLQRYDEQRLDEKTGRQAGMRSLPLDEALKGIASLKLTLVAKGEATELFGQLRGDGLASALATIDQGFGDELFYQNVATRAAHLLYFVIKNHPLADGNKRTGSFLFLWYLRANEHLLARPVERLINDNTLVALALLVAESRPEQKELMVKLVEHFVLLKEDAP